MNLYCDISVLFLAFVINEVACRGVVINHEESEKNITESTRWIFEERNPNQLPPVEPELSTRDDSIVEAMCLKFRYPVKTKLEFSTGEVTPGAYRTPGHNDRDRIQPATRFRRDRDKKLSTSNRGGESSAKDYMSTYYAQRKLIMEKYKSQQRENLEKLNRTKSLIAASKKLRDSKKVTAAGIPDSHTTVLDDMVTTANSAGRNMTLAPSRTPSTFDRFGNIRATTPTDLTSQNEDNIDSTEPTWVVRNRDNDTWDSYLGHQSSDYRRKNDTDLNHLEDIFFWDVRSQDGRLPRSTDTPTKEVENSISNSNNVSIGVRSDSRASIGFPGSAVETQSSPKVHVTKNLKNVQTSTTMYRNSTHEIVQVGDVVTSSKNITNVPYDVDEYSNNNYDNSANPTITAPLAETAGGARESEWCEECSHDYKWGNCEGTLFYQHNIFLRNRGPSAIDAIFGMDVQGPVYITCVEAFRYNRTRGIVTLHSGGPANDFAQLRIRGFQGEGISYIMKVWGVSSGDLDEVTTTSYPQK
ncbi:uncharacterized protein LOC105686889 [Athalia rosae]|uniref:uncharacterized protein LOC105686889 n=1 Tax=Athalia rosae TaxID=37344 RepID=UPI0020333B0B|nr:uncharacterized protein LOC105686889 [Athalia rosae]